MCTISVEAQPTMKMNIHNQCSGFKLMNQRYFGNGTNWSNELDEEVDVGNITNANLTPLLAVFRGAAMYELQRKRVESDDQLKSIYTLLFVGWKTEGYKKLHVFIQLMEYDKTFRWQNYKLEEYYQRYDNQFSTYTDSIKDIWLMHDGTVLMTKLELDFTLQDGVLNIIISEGVKDEYTKRPVWLDSKM
jgi:hypothetical protein